MKNKLIDLNNHLFEQIERLNDEDLTREELDTEIARSKAMSGIADKIIKNAELAFKVLQHNDEYGRKTSNKTVTMLDMKEDD